MELGGTWRNLAELGGTWRNLELGGTWRNLAELGGTWRNLELGTRNLELGTRNLELGGTWNLAELELGYPIYGRIGASQCRSEIVVLGAVWVDILKCFIVYDYFDVELDK